MIRIGKNYLRDIVKVAWEAFKAQFSRNSHKKQLNQLIKTIIYLISIMSYIKFSQQNMLILIKLKIKKKRDLKPLQITNRKHIKLFCNDFFTLIEVSANYYNSELEIKILNKLSRNQIRNYINHGHS